MKQATFAVSTAIVLALGLASPIVSAQAQPAAQGMVKAKPAAGQELIAAEVKGLDKDSGKVTLAHGEVKSLDMPAMTMAYAVKDPAMFAMLSEGAKVRVALSKSATGYTVVHVEPAG
jgi:Cu(I)/Ag(I) efflux system periplasmic protein CusF